jgi:hypothetical protein
MHWRRFLPSVVWKRLLGKWEHVKYHEHHQQVTVGRNLPPKGLFVKLLHNNKQHSGTVLGFIVLCWSSSILRGKYAFAYQVPHILRLQVMRYSGRFAELILCKNFIKGPCVFVQWICMKCDVLHPKIVYEFCLSSIFFLAENYVYGKIVFLKNAGFFAGHKLRILLF